MEPSAFEDVLQTALRLLIGAGVPIWMVALAAVALAVLLVMAPRAGRAIAAAVRAAKPTPQIVADENGPQPPGVPGPTESDRPAESESGSGG